MVLSRKKLQKVGNSTAVLLPADVLQAAGLHRGEEVLLHAEQGRIVLTRLDPDFDEMVAAADAFTAAHPNALRKLGQ